MFKKNYYDYCGSFDRNELAMYINSKVYFIRLVILFGVCDVKVIFLD